jgi:hypothetical protein
MGFWTKLFGQEKSAKGADEAVNTRKQPSATRAVNEGLRSEDRGTEQDGQAETDFTPFVTRATQGPAVCTVAINDWLALYVALCKALIGAGMSHSDVLHAVNDRLFGVCPRCHGSSTGDGLSTLYIIKRAASFSGAPPSANRLLAGRCPNETCPCRNIMIYWKADENPEAIASLAAMGVTVTPRG